MPAHVELSSKPTRDLKWLGPGPERKVIIDVLRVGLVAVPPPDNLDIKPLKGHPPYLRLRVGDYRTIYRPLDAFEIPTVMQRRGMSKMAFPGYLVARIVHRRDLERAVAALL